MAQINDDLGSRWGLFDGEFVCSSALVRLGILLSSRNRT